MIKIKLKHKDAKRFALIDDEDYEKVMKYKWHYEPKGTGYANFSKWYPNKKYSRNIDMARVVMDCIEDKSIVVDHISGNSLDNRKSNLRKCTHQQNTMNRAKDRTGVCKYKGVTKTYLNTFPFKSHICVNGNKINLGAFLTQEEAALAYNEAAKKYHGEFARLNFSS